MLDAMHGAVPVSPAAVPSFAAQFAERRASAGWDAVVAQWLDAHAPLPRDRVLALMSEGRAASSGDMVLGLTPGPSVGLARVALLRIGLLEIETAGVRARAPFGWTADPDDAVHLAGSMHLRPSAFVALAADHHARELVAGAADAPSALAHASQLDCAGLADQLLGATPTATSYEGCDAACTTQLCARGLANAWRAVREASTSAEEVQIGIAASAQARVGAYAEPLFFEGAWVGQVSSLARPTFGVKGRARGAQATSPF